MYKPRRTGIGIETEIFKDSNVEREASCPFSLAFISINALSYVEGSRRAEQGHKYSPYCSEQSYKLSVYGFLHIFHHLL